MEGNSSDSKCHSETTYDKQNKTNGEKNKTHQAELETIKSQPIYFPKYIWEIRVHSSGFWWGGKLPPISWSLKP